MRSRNQIYSIWLCAYIQCQKNERSEGTSNFYALQIDNKVSCKDKSAYFIMSFQNKNNWVHLPLFHIQFVFHQTYKIQQMERMKEIE